MQFSTNNAETKGDTNRRMRLAIVDDNESVRKAIDRLCRSDGYETECFCSAEEFLERESLNAVDCLIVDLELPGISGLELQAKTLALGANVPLIMITASDDNGTRKLALDRGAHAFLQKPFPAHRLLAAIRRAISERSR